MVRDEDELAAVLGHEMAHVVANHPAERMSASIIALITISAISMLFDITGRLPSALAHMIYLLPNSRATEVGFYFLRLWLKMEANVTYRLRQIVLD